MANERTYPCLPCGDLDEAIAFYQVLGFTRVYRQIAPNPYAVVAREDLNIHLFGIPNFNPAGLRAAYGKLPSVGYPRITRPRKRFGTVRGFSVVDVGGNWLRISKAGDTEEGAAAEPTADLAKILNVAARLGDAHGDEARALKTLEAGLKKFPDAPVIDHARALLYRAELAIRLDKAALARSSLAAARALKLTPRQRALIVQELAQTSDLVAGEP